MKLLADEAAHPAENFPAKTDRNGETIGFEKTSAEVLGVPRELRPNRPLPSNGARPWPPNGMDNEKLRLRR
jgi:hypothetical protein